MEDNHPSANGMTADDSFEPTPLSRTIRCRSVPYRQGVVEVAPAIHAGCVNIETWQISAHWKESGPASVDQIPESAFEANTELELTPGEARALARALLDAADVAELPRFEIDGSRFSTLEVFFDEASRVLAPGEPWGRNLDAFNDILRGGFGTPSGGFLIIWAHHGLSRERLGYPETVRQLALRLSRCHPENRTRVATELAAARRAEGPTVFDWLVEIISAHGPGGQEAEDGVRLELR
ncbi:barstar family protein [Polyangium sp. y55x31]|uniref:barstar family protein n=1 Tax=Polyangium sp. y55x31 TaxID=3042688 RepID=UPI00248294C5|nr:barstar family protein [Polyangium sp. y55x31]MDI1476861.1 barstar family protein [Polyangium sp. y55x31]